MSVSEQFDKNLADGFRYDPPIDSVELVGFVPQNSFSLRPSQRHRDPTGRENPLLPVLSAHGASSVDANSSLTAAADSTRLRL